MSAQVQSSYWRPRIFPYNGDISDAEIDRAQAIDPTGSTNWEKVEEIGRDGLVGHLKKIPTIGYRLTQYEYGSFEFWRKITNKSDATTTLTLNDFKTAAFDIAAYLTDDEGTFLGTLVYSELRTAGFSINIGSPDAIIERNFDFVGEQFNIWQGDNKYYIYDTYTCTSGADNDIDLSSISPAEDPDNPSDYILRVLRVRGTVTTELVRGVTYSFEPTTDTLTISAVQTGDIIKSYYTSATAPAAIFTNNDTDVAGILADSAEIYLYVAGSGNPSSSDYLYKVQSCTLDVRFEREDVKEIGSAKVVSRSVKDKTVTVTLGKLQDSTFKIEEVLRGVTSGYGRLDITQMSDEAAVIIKIFSDKSKTNFQYGFLATTMAPRDITPGAAVNETVKAGVTLEGEDLTITTTEGSLV
ncbi:hypothetical protein LCGC14_1718920 [marine sediment metagenome]|uniref:Uncharacterized protein n=1 Tax=marine sediment metagenome TaxID=412755 RepID=A0A0F9I0P9_9ZZZZ